MSGVLSCDIGLKHMVFCFNESESSSYQIFTFDVQREKIQEVLQQLWYHVKNIIDEIGKDKIKLMVIESQMQGTLNIQVMYAVCMIFTIEGIYYQLQPARSKYSVYEKNTSSNNFKVRGAQDITERHLRKNNIVVKYNKLQRFNFQNHRWYNDYPDLRDFLQKNKIEKFDDIADTILMIEEYRRSEKKIMQRNGCKKQQNKNFSDDIDTENIVDELKTQLLSQ